MFPSPYVSIIIPSFNTASYILQAVKSALDQTFGNLEVIVVDDASTDDTLELLATIADPRLRIFQNQENRGAAFTRNYAINEARGEWIAVLDSDDWYSPERIEILLGIAEDTQADMVADDQWFIEGQSTTHSTTQINLSGERITETTVIDSVRFVDTDIYGGLTLGISKTLISRTFLNKYHLRYDENILAGEDFIFYLDCLIMGARFILHPYPYYFYRLNRTGALTTKSPVKKIIMRLCAIEKRLTFPQVLCHEELMKSLKHNADIYKQYLCYYRVVSQLKNRQWVATLEEIIKYPYFFIIFIKRFPQIILRRLRFKGLFVQ